LDLEQLRDAMANSDKINSSSSLNHAPSSFSTTTNIDDNKMLRNQTLTDTNYDDLIRQFDSLVDITNNSKSNFYALPCRSSLFPT